MCDFNNLILKRYLDVSEANATNIAFIIKEISYTYSEFNQYISNIIIALRKCNLSNTMVGLVANDDIYTYASIFALWHEGLAYIPLHPMQPKTRCMDIVVQVGIELIIDSSKDSRYDKEAIVLKPFGLKNKMSFKFLPKNVSDKNLAYILFTSGSTGKPKGVKLSRKNIAAFVSAFEKSGIDLSVKDRCLQCFDLTFDVSVQLYLVPLLNGASVYTLPVECMKYAYAADLIERHELTFAAMAPSMVRFLKPYFGELNMTSLKYCILTAEASHLSLIKEWSSCVKNAQLYDFYGPTEATIYCTFYKLPQNIAQIKNRNDVVFIGKPMDGVKAIIINQENELLINEVGELCIAGDQLTEGYWQMPEKEEEVFFNKEINGKLYKFYRTGDLCKFDKDGDIEYIGRIDFQAKIQGYRVELGEIECAISEVANKDTVALAIKDFNEDDFVVAFVESEMLDVLPILSYLKDRLPNYMIPRKIISLPQFPLNNNGKIDRKQLIEIYYNLKD